MQSRRTPFEEPAFAGFSLGGLQSDDELAHVLDIESNTVRRGEINSGDGGRG
jgi:hypothetical protein